MPKRLVSLDIRVANSLRRIGYESITVRHLGDGRVELSGALYSLDDQRLILTATRTVVGVTEIVNSLQVESPGNSGR